MAIAVPLHCFDVLDEIDAVFADVVESANKRGHIYGVLRSLAGGVDRGSLFLRKTESHVHAHLLPHGHLRSSQAFVGTRIFDVRVGNPGEHLLALSEQVFGTRIEVRKNLDRDTWLADQWRDGLNYPSVLFLFFLSSQGMPGGNS